VVQQSSSNSDPKIVVYTSGMGRPLQSVRHPQGAHIAALRKSKSLTQAEAAEILGVPQANLARWERIAKPPRADVLPLMAKLYGVSVDDLFYAKRSTQKPPVGKVQALFNELTKLPRTQQHKVVEVLEAMMVKYKRAG
jgi:transcriptional regulator with XRE-family HTH domain